ncbi:unnamed protein product [Cylicostephanus goldi]|uniref:Uncharacterized protein n=1 Tax=Cylicostephanus goldi TaxID=71465 RepID=A0A3P6QRK9_CYLGO|nr:unnamed protein product [Cylicostephanus goldi]
MRAVLTPPIMMFVGFYAVLDPFINGPWVQANMDFISGSVEIKFWDFFTDSYEKPWTRCPPFLIGMAAGYILSLGKKPKLNKFFIIPLWILAAAVALASLYGSHDYQAGDDAWR